MVSLVNTRILPFPLKHTNYEVWGIKNNLRIGCELTVMLTAAVVKGEERAALSIRMLGTSFQLSH